MREETYVTSAGRARVVRSVADLVPRPDEHARNVFVGIDGVDGSGKTIFADELATVLSARQPTVRLSIDGFHHRRQERYRQGRDSPDGFWRDSYDYEAFDRHVISPLRSGLGPYLAASHDLDTDVVLDGPALWLDEPSVIVVDGIFLHRPELRDVWDFSVFLEVEFDVSMARMATRDGSDPDPAAVGNRRYVEGQRIYLQGNAPQRLASISVDNNDLRAPRILRSS
jgi:uridine kinase